MEIDKENDGFITIDKFNKALKELDYNPEMDSDIILQQCDLDNDDKIDFKEFC